MIALATFSKPRQPRVSIYPAKGEDGFKSSENWLAEALGAKWSRRSGYTVASAARAALFSKLAKAGVTASRRFLASNREPYTFQLPGCATKHSLAGITRAVESLGGETAGTTTHT